MKFNLPTFTIVVRDPSDEERRTQCSDRDRDYYAIDIRKKGERYKLTMYVGSPIYMTQGKVWNEATAARSALSFANASYCMDDATQREWSETHGDNLCNEAFSHRILGSEMRSE